LLLVIGSRKDVSRDRSCAFSLHRLVAKVNNDAMVPLLHQFLDFLLIKIDRIALQVQLETPLAMLEHLRNGVFEHVLVVRIKQQLNLTLLLSFVVDQNCALVQIVEGKGHRRNFFSFLLLAGELG
jgi:hypothetical protein